ncbi:hypothetical protein Gpo141_00004534 [Globisporangium polare]
MEKDLRDAYKALKLMRADLTRTKREKQALEHQLSLYLQQLEAHTSHSNNKHHHDMSADESSSAPALRTTERALMQEEDARAQLQRLQAAHLALQREYDRLKSEMVKAQTIRTHSVLHELDPFEVDDLEAASNQRKDTTAAVAAAAFEYYIKAETGKGDSHNHNRSNQDEESELTAETEPIEDDDHQDDQRTKHKQLEPHQDQEEDTPSMEEMVREKLGLLANLYTLKTKLDEQAVEILEQQAAFAQERDELCLRLEASGVQMSNLKAHAKEMEYEKQVFEEKYDFLVTELELIKQQPGDASSSDEGTGACETEDAELGDPQSVPDEENPVDEPVETDRTTLEAKLRELEVIREQLETERSVLRLQKQQQSSSVEAENADKLEAVETESARRIDGLMQTNAILQQQLAEKDEELANLNASLTHERVTASEQHGLEKECRALKASLTEASEKISELGVQLLATELEKSDLAAARQNLEREIETLKRDAVSSEFERKLSAVSQTNMIVQQQLQEKELEIAHTKDEMKREVALCKEELATAVQDREQAAEELRDALEELEQRDTELTRRSDKLSQLESQAREQLEAHDKLTERFQHQQDSSQHLEQEVATLKRDVSEKDESLVSLQSDVNSFSEQMRALETELADSRGAASRLETENLSLEKQVESLQNKLQQEIEALKQTHEQQLKFQEDDFQAQEAEKLSSQQAQHEKLLKGSAMEVKALLHETRQLKQSLKLKDDELIASRSATESAKAELLAVKDGQERATLLAVEARDLLQYRLSVLETQLMAIEDKKSSEEDAYDDFAIVDGSDVNARAWGFIKQKVRTLNRFLPQLQSFAYFLDMTLCLCEANASTLEALSIQHAGGGILTQEIVSFLRFASQLQRGAGATSHVKQGRRLHHQVLELLSNWFECSENDDIPAPPFGIASREASLVLHNWTSDKSKRVAAKRWLERMESVAGLSSPENGSESLAAEGSTLELQQMTMEVKQAFLMLIVPILKRNPAIYVRVFTRKTIVAASAGSVEDREDASWEMKIHVQLADALLRRRSPLSASSSSSSSRTASSPQLRARPPPLKLSSSLPSMRHGELENHQQVSTPTSSQKLQIIQERLQRMQNR